MPLLLHEIVPALQRLHCNPGCFKPLRYRTEHFQIFFLPFAISEWNKLDSDNRNVGSYSLFRKNLLSFIRPIEKSVYDPLEIKVSATSANKSSDITFQIL